MEHIKAVLYGIPVVAAFVSISWVLAYIPFAGMSALGLAISYCFGQGVLSFIKRREK